MRKPDRGLSWGGSKRLLAAIAATAIMALPGTALAKGKPTPPPDNVSISLPVEGPTTFGVSWS